MVDECFNIFVLKFSISVTKEMQKSEYYKEKREVKKIKGSYMLKLPQIVTANFSSVVNIS